MCNIYISAVDNRHSMVIHNMPQRKRLNNTITKVKTSRSVINDHVYMQIKPMDLVHKSNIIYSVSDRTFYKNRFGTSENDVSSLPEDLKPLFKSIIEVSNEIPYNELSQCRSIITEAIYLTGTMNQYIADLDLIEYQLLKVKYGEQPTKEFLKVLVEDYPELII